MFIDNIFQISAGFAATLLVSIIIVVTKHMHGSLTFDSSVGVQKFHQTLTPRIGGISIITGFFVAWFFMEGETREIWGLVGLAGLPALLFGLTEDITQKVGVRTRLLATIAAGLIFSMLTGFSITHVDVPGIDLVLGVPIIAVAFTAFAIGGVANAINLIDGFHGLAAGTLVIICLAFALVGWRVGDTVLVSMALTMAAIVGGFLVVNFPLGKLFLGDAGAYFSGYVVAVFAVMLPARNSEISPWISLLILGYPVTETVVSIVRRLLDRNASPGDPDSAHLHHVVHRKWAKNITSRLAVPEFQNAGTGALMWMLPLLTFVFVANSSFRPLYAVAYLAAFVVIYLLLYRMNVTPHISVQKG